MFLFLVGEEKYLCVVVRGREGAEDESVEDVDGDAGKLK